MPCMCSCVEAVRSLQQALEQAGLASVVQLPLLHRATVTAALCAAPILRLGAVLNAEEVPPSSQRSLQYIGRRDAGVGGALDAEAPEAGRGGPAHKRGNRLVSFRPAPGADGTYDKAKRALTEAENAYALELRRLDDGVEWSSLPEQGAAALLQRAQREEATACSRVLASAAQQFLDSYDLFGSPVAAVADLDVLAAFAAVSTAPAPPGCAFCRPVFVSAAPDAAGGGGDRPTLLAKDAMVLDLQDLWHPLLAAGSGGGGGSVVPSDVRLGASLPAALLLTGRIGRVRGGGAVRGASYACCSRGQAGLLRAAGVKVRATSCPAAAPFLRHFGCRGRCRPRCTQAPTRVERARCCALPAWPWSWPKSAATCPAAGPASARWMASSPAWVGRGPQAPATHHRRRHGK